VRLAIAKATAAEMHRDIRMAMIKALVGLAPKHTKLAHGPASKNSGMCGRSSASPTGDRIAPWCCDGHHIPVDFAPKRHHFGPPRGGTLIAQSPMPA